MVEFKGIDWLKGDDRIGGFESKGGVKGVTSGIQIWSKAYICEKEAGEKVTCTVLFVVSYLPVLHKGFDHNDYEVPI